jgi:hypothetical protein
MKKTKHIEVPFDVAAAGAGAHYAECIRNGCTPRMAEMLAMRQAPRGMTDDVYMAGMQKIGTTLDKLNRFDRERMLGEARKHGYTIKGSEVYEPGVARFPMDPKAMFDHGRGLGDMKKLLEKRGVESHGHFTTKGRNDKPPERQKHQLHPRLVKRHLQRMVKDDPSLALKNRRELVESIIDKHGSPKVKE